MPRTIAKQPRDTVGLPSISLTVRRTVSSEAESIIPEGFRQATTAEVVQKCKGDPEFAIKLYERGPVWTAGDGPVAVGVISTTSGRKLKVIQNPGAFVEASVAYVPLPKPGIRDVSRN